MEPVGQRGKLLLLNMSFCIRFIPTTNKCTATFIILWYERWWTFSRSCVTLKQEEIFGEQDDKVLAVSTFDDDLVLRRRASEIDSSPNYFSLKKLLTPFLDLIEEDGPSLHGSNDSANSKKEEKKTKHVIPYFHVDGVSAS